MLEADHGPADGGSFEPARINQTPCRVAGGVLEGAARAFLLGLTFAGGVYQAILARTASSVEGVRRSLTRVTILPGGRSECR